MFSCVLSGTPRQLCFSLNCLECCSDGVECVTWHGEKVMSVTLVMWEVGRAGDQAGKQEVYPPLDKRGSEERALCRELTQAGNYLYSSEQILLSLINSMRADSTFDNFQAGLQNPCEYTRWLESPGEACHGMTRWMGGTSKVEQARNSPSCTVLSAAEGFIKILSQEKYAVLNLRLHRLYDLLPTEFRKILANT